jgi:hypothetical protein
LPKEAAMEGNREEILKSEQEESEDQQVVLRDNKRFLCGKPPTDVEDSKIRDYCEKFLEE